METDRRGNDRVSATLFAELTTGEQYTISGKTIDISVHGALLECHMTLPLGTTCQLKFILHDKNDIQIDVSGTVVRTEGDQMAVEFQQVTLGSYQQLQDLIQQNMATDPGIRQDIKNK